MPNKYFNKLKDYLNNLNAERRERTRLEKEEERELRKQKENIYREEYRRASLEAARIKAKQDVFRSTGIEKLRAINRKHNLNNKSPNYLSRLSEYTQANKLRHQQNQKRVEELRRTANSMRAEKLNNPKRFY
jgi:hypothetical protein